MDSGTTSGRPRTARESRLIRFLRRSVLRAPRRWRLEDVLTELTFRLRGRARRALLEDRDRLPRALYIEATNICNAACVFCAYPRMERAKVGMTMDLFMAVIDQYVALGGRHVSLTPIVGDPFVDRHLHERLDHLAGRPEIASYHFFTNAILLDRDESRRLAAHGERLRVCVSMGGFDRETYHRIMGVDRFDTVWRNLQDFVAEKERSGSGVVLQIHVRCGRRDRCGPVWRQLEAWRDRGLLEIATIADYDSWSGKIGGHELEEHGLEPTPMPHQRGPCELLYMKPVVLADGRVNACACRDVEAELVVGDLRRQTLVEILDGPELEALRRRHHEGDLPEVCRRCTYYVSIYNPVRGRIGASDLSWDRD